MVPNVGYSNSPPSHVTLPFEYRTPILSGIQVLGIQMVTVHVSLRLLSSFNLVIFQAESTEIGKKK